MFFYIFYTELTLFYKDRSLRDDSADSDLWDFAGFQHHYCLLLFVFLYFFIASFFHSFHFSLSLQQWKKRSNNA